MAQYLFLQPHTVTCGNQDNLKHCLRTCLLQQGNILRRPEVRFARSSAISPIGNLAGLCTEGIPDRRTAAISIDTALDLVGRRSKSL